MLNTLGDYVENGLGGKSETTIKTYQHALKQFEEWLAGAGTNLNDFARADVQQYIDYLTSKRKSSATINKVFNAIKSFCRWSGKKELVEGISVIKQPDFLKQAPKALNQLERRRLIREVDRSGNKRNYAIVIVLLNTGIRLSELTALERHDLEIRERKGTLIVRNGKGNKERVIPLNAETRRALSKYLEERNDNEEALFLSNRYKRISQRTVQNIIKNQGFNVHQLRHTFITELVRGKEDISKIQALSGHASADLIFRYSQPSKEDLQSAVEKIYK